MQAAIYQIPLITPCSSLKFQRNASDVAVSYIHSAGAFKVEK
jgi:hypothetical protein